MRQLADFGRRKGNALPRRDESEQSAEILDLFAKARRKSRRLTRCADRSVASGELLFGKPDEFVSAQLRERNPFAQRKQMVVGKDSLKRNALQCSEREFALESSAGIAEERKINATIAQRFHLITRRHFAQRDFDVGILLREATKRRRQNAGQRWRDVADGEFIPGGLPEQRHFLDCISTAPEQVSRVRKKCFSGGRQFEAGLVALEELDTEFRFEVAQLAADCRLRNAQAGGGAADIQLFGGGDKVAEVPQFHSMEAITQRHQAPKNKALGGSSMRGETASMKTTTLNRPRTDEPTIVKRAAAARGRTELGWLHSRHTFSFGNYFDPDQMGFRSLRVINDDVVEPGEGFGEHPHRDAEIFSYVIEGELEHKDSMGNGRVIKPGDLQYMSAGRGVFHSEFNPSPERAVHFLQIWLMPKMGGGEPRYAEKALGNAARPNELTLLFAGEPRDGAVGIRADADIYFGRLDAGKRLVHRPSKGRGQWMHVIAGELSVSGEELKSGDGAAIENVDALEIQSNADAQFLLFDLK